MVTHDPVAASYAERVVLMNDGELVGELDHPDADSVLAALAKLGPEHAAGSARTGEDARPALCRRRAVLPRAADVHLAVRAAAGQRGGPAGPAAGCAGP